MANTSQARKRVRQAEKHRVQNASARSQMRTSIKRVIKQIESGDQEAARSAYQQAVPLIDRMARKGLFHKNAAARRKSRLNQRLRAMGDS